jgi:hypothetical protein
MKHSALLLALFLGCAHQAAPPPAPTPAAPAPLGVEAAGKLHGFLHKLKCGDLQDARSCKLSPDQERSRTDVVLAGDPATTYDLKLRVRGLVEPRRYQGGALHDPANKWFYAGGTPDPLRKGGGHAYNIYQIAVSDPKQDYYLNRDTEDYLGKGYMPGHTIYKLDYSVSIKAKGGATISVITDDLAKSGMINNADKQVVEGVPASLIEQPWDGQFFYLEVESITPA